MSTFKALFSFFLFLSLGPATAVAKTGSKNLDVCLQQALRGGDPSNRDLRRTQCLKSFGKNLELKNCLKVAQGFEYGSSSEDAKMFCATDRNASLNTKQCLFVVKKLEFNDDREGLLWGCLQNLNERLTRTECRQLALQMPTLVQKTRASSYCQNEIKAAL